MTTAVNLLYVRYALSDLRRAETFMTDFGLTTVQRSETLLRMRGANIGPFIYEAVLAEKDAFLGLGFQVSSLTALEYLASLPDSGPLETLDDGKRVRMHMQDGFQVDAFWSGVTPTDMALRPANAFNNGAQKPRRNASVRQQRQAEKVLRLGHVVLHVSNHAASVAWLQERLGLLASDYFGPTSDPATALGTFLCIDGGMDWVDHHCLLVLQADAVGVHHCSFEMQDLDAVMGAHDYLSSRGYQLDCGVGRHLLGSQIFDYWRDPFGFRVEHYTDGDVVNTLHQPGVFTGTADQTTQWGAIPSATFFDLP